MNLLPRIEGLIERRILLNYRMPPDLATEKLPPIFSPRVVNGHALVGVCLIQFSELRPAGAPKVLGMSTENAAHRISVTLPEGEEATGVYVFQRHSDSRFMACAGGKLFPGVHQRADFRNHEKAGRLEVSLTDEQGELLGLKARAGDKWDSAVFDSHQEASDYFCQDRQGYSPDRSGNNLEGLRLTCHQWQTDFLEVASARVREFESWSSEIKFDHALIMHNIPHQWDALEKLPCPSP